MPTIPLQLIYPFRDMALLQPFSPKKFLFKSNKFPQSNNNNNNNNPYLGTSRIAIDLDLLLRLRQPQSRWNPRFKLKVRAVTDQVGGKGINTAEKESIGKAVNYDWSEEWYPLYLTKNIPDDAPLGLTVFDKQLVLYRDGNGDLSCFEDRCPHR